MEISPEDKAKLEQSLIAKYYSNNLKANVCVSLLQELLPTREYNVHEVVLAVVVSHPEREVIFDWIDLVIEIQKGSSVKDMNLPEIVEGEYIKFLSHMKNQAVKCNLMQ